MIGRLLIFLLFSPSLLAQGLEGSADTWLLYLTDNFDTQSVLEVYATDNCNDVGDLEPIYIAYGKEREDVQCDEGQCCIERVIRDGEVIAERVIQADGERSVAADYETGDTLLHSLGMDATYEAKDWKAVIDGDFRHHLLGSRALYGSRKYRFHITDLYAEIQKEKKDKDLRLRAGRQSLLGGVLIDGLKTDLLWKGDREMSAGVFAGLAPDPRSKHPSIDRAGFGADFHYIPAFSSKSRTKFLLDLNLYGETYEWKMNRFSLFSRSHFTPIPELSLFHYWTLELPVPGEDNSIKSSYFSLRSIYHPHRKWTISGGFSQFRISRFLQQDSVRYITDAGSLQHERVGGKLDQSQRYRFDLRMSFKPIPLVRPYIEGRYERRTFDGSKKFQNKDPNSPDDNSLPEENLNLLNRKNAYGGSTGFRLFFLEDWSTDSRFSYNRRFQSNGYDFLQEVSWSPNPKWSADTYFQILWSSRDIRNSIPDSAALKVDTKDYYAGLGASYRFRSDLLAQIRYDFACEEDYSLSSNILIHSALLRLDYRF